MALNGQEISFFMSVGVSPTPIPDQSFQELRVQDYMKAYQTTGRPPLPCPQSPETPKDRIALGLPPLFVPVAIPVPTDKSGGTSNTSESPVNLPTDLPANHAFQSTKSLLDEYYQSISAQTLYSHFSHEELRHYAYLAGNKMPPPDSTAIGMTNAPVNAEQVHPFYANDSSSIAYATSTAVSGPPDYFMSVSASPRFDKHSFEELRTACLLAGKEVGSSEMPTRGGLPARPAPTLFGRPRGDGFSSTMHTDIGVGRRIVRGRSVRRDSQIRPILEEDGRFS
ncbi:hypothetical protein BS17DRAFT_809478 [Gyrodon lividus]|nr:hypothetical protein BS17DRAFT_809478 [Gyrodon lividus]